MESSRVGGRVGWLVIIQVHVNYVHELDILFTLSLGSVQLGSAGSIRLKHRQATRAVSLFALIPIQIQTLIQI